MKKPLDDLTKAKLIYSGELLAFSIAFLVLGILTLTKVIAPSETKINIITWFTLIGGTLLIANTVWFFVSEKKRKRGSLLDTLLLLPVPLMMIPLDIIHLSTKAVPDSAYSYIIGGLFLYITVIYVIEAIFHYFNPLPLLVEAAKEEEQRGKETEDAEKKLTDPDDL